VVAFGRSAYTGGDVHRPQSRVLLLFGHLPETVLRFLGFYSAFHKFINSTIVEVYNSLATHRTRIEVEFN
jgi:hypothetical protein